MLLLRYKQEVQQLDQKQKAVKEQQRALKDTTGDAAHQMEMLEGVHKLLQLKLRLHKQGNLPGMQAAGGHGQGQFPGAAAASQQTVGTANVMTL